MRESHILIGTRHSQSLQQGVTGEGGGRCLCLKSKVRLIACTSISRRGQDLSIGFGYGEGAAFPDLVGVTPCFLVEVSFLMTLTVRVLTE